MFWTIEFFPRCIHHVFLSHSAEDRGVLVHPLYEALRGLGIRAWLDRHDYPYGRGSRAALRDAVLICRHVVFLITDATLTQARGWCVQELAWADLLQDNLVQPGGPALVNVALPLDLVDPADPRLPRSVWQTARERGPYCPTGGDQVAWATDQVRSFLHREQALMAEFRRYARQNKQFRDRLRSRGGLFDRVTRFDPHLLPASP